MCKHLGWGSASPCLLNFGHYVTKIPPADITPAGLFYVNVSRTY